MLQLRARVSGRARIGFPPTRDVPNNLPAAVTTFVGRQPDIEAIVDLLSGAAPTPRLVTLTGTGGVGKTRLALEVAGEFLRSPTFNDGIWLVELASLSDPRRLAQAVAAVLGLQEDADRPFADVLVDALRLRRSLLILDNCEHLIDACADLVATLLRACPHLSILATSREPLKVSGEHARGVPSLDRPDPMRLPPLERIAEFDAVRLFAERARAASGDFQLTEGNAHAVAQVCARLDGLALALELAAARVRALSVDQIAARLDDRFRLLGDASRGTPPRQQTLLAAVTWSYDLLRADERRLLNQLAVFVGGWTLDDAERVCDSSEPTPVLDLLARLIEKSLVLTEDGPNQSKWYRLQETIRHFAADRLRESGEEATVRVRHFDWYVELAENAHRYLRFEPLPWSRRNEYVARLRLELANLRAAWQWALVDEARNEDGLRLVAALFPWFYVDGLLNEGREVLVALLDASRGAEPSVARAWGLAAAAKLAAHSGDDATAVRLADEYLALPARVWHGAATAYAHNAHGLVYLRRGDFARARAHVMAALEAARAAADTQTVPLYLVYLGSVAAAEGRLDEAQAVFTQAVTLGREVDFPIAVGLSLGGLARIVHLRGDSVRARELYEQALRTLADVQVMPQTALMHVGLGHLALEASDLPRLAVHLNNALELGVRLGHREALLAALEGVAMAVAQTGRAVESAVRLFGATQRLRELSPSGPPNAAVGQVLSGALAALDSQVSQDLLGEGRGMTLEDAVTLARALLADASTVDSGTSSGEPTLTRREREVADLLAHGCTNRQIADTLVVAERTAEMHVSNVLAKLRMTSRAQAAVWAAQHLAGRIP